MSLAALCPRRSTALQLRVIIEEVGLKWRTPQTDADAFLDEVVRTQPRFGLITEQYLHEPTLFAQLRAAHPAIQLLICLTTDNGQPPAPDWEQLDKLDFDMICTLPELPDCLRALSADKSCKSAVVPPLTKTAPVSPLPGFADLTPAQRRVLAYSCRLEPVALMADKLSLSERTIANHRYEIAQKLQVRGGPGSLTRFIAANREQLLQLLNETANK